MSRLLTDAELTRQLSELDLWSWKDGSIHRIIECAGFPQAIALVVEAADEAEQMDHHPDIDIRWRTVTFVLTTHSAGGLTQLDIELAHRIEALIAETS